MVKYVQKPYIVKVERKVPIQIVQKVAVPQPIVHVEPIVAEPQHVHANAYNGHANAYNGHAFNAHHHPW